MSWDAPYPNWPLPQEGGLSAYQQDADSGAPQPVYQQQDTTINSGALPTYQQDADSGGGQDEVTPASSPLTEAAKPADKTPQIIDALTQQILGQNLTDKWTGQGYGSAEANARDMARIMAGIGITDINQFGKFTQTGLPEQVNPDGNGGFVDMRGNKVDPSMVTADTQSGESGEWTSYTAPVGTQEVFGNKETKQAVPNTYSERQTGNFWGGTFEGSGNTGYGVQFDAQGKPYFYTQGASSNNIATLMKDLGPVGQIALAVATGGLSVPEQLAANMALQVASGVKLKDAITGAAISYAGAQIPGLDAIKEGASFLNGLDSTGVLSNAFQNAAVSGAKAALTGQNISDAVIAGAATGGINGAVNAVLRDDAFSNLSASDKKIAANAITGVISGKSIDQVLINSAIAAANSAVAENKAAETNQVVSPYFTPTTTTVAGVEEPPTGALQVATTTPTPPPVEPTPTGALQLATATPTTTTDAGNGFTMPGIDEKTASTLAGFNEVNKIATGATTLPDWVKLAEGEEVTGTRFDSQGQQRYEITRANPNDPDKPVVYDAVRDPTTGQVTYEWGGVAFDENGNVLSGGTTISSGSKPSWTWPTETEAPTNASTPPETPLPSPIEFTNPTPPAATNVELGALGNAAPASTPAALPVDTGTNTSVATTPVTTPPPVDTTTSSTTGPVIVNPLSSVTTQQPPPPVNTNTTNTAATTPASPTTGALSSATSSTVNPATTATSSTVNPAATTSSAVNLSSTGNPTSTATSSTPGTPGGNTAGTPGGTPSGNVNGMPNGSLTGVVGGTNNGVTDGTGTGPGDGTNGTGPATTNPPSGALPTTPPEETPPEETPTTPPEETPTTSSGTSSGSSSGTSSGSKSTKTTTTQYGALSSTATPTSTGALPGTLTATMLAAAPVKDLSGTMTQLTQLYPQLAHVDPRLLQILTSRAGTSLPSQQESAANEGTGLIGARLAGAPSPGNPTKGEDNSTVIPGVSTGNLTGAGLKYLNGAPLTPFANGGQAQHIPEFITGKTGNYVQGAGDGQSDSIPAMLADGEYVFDADTVAALGNGSNKAGALVLDKMRENIRKHKRSASVDKIPPKAMSPLSYLKGIK